MKNNIKSIRKQLSFTQRDLAKKTGISRPYLSSIENNKKEPSTTIALKISKALKKTVEEIFFDESVHHGEQVENTA